MSSQDVIKTALVSILFLLLQVLFVRNLVLYDVAFCFIYLIIILWLPGEMDTLWVIIVSFVVGIFLDMFYNTAGVHAAACTLIGYIRKPLLRSFFPSRGLENEIHTSLVELGHQRYLVYITIVSSIHLTVLFFIEAGGFNLFLNTITKIITSLIFSVLVIYLISVFSYNLGREKK